MGIVHVGKPQGQFLKTPSDDQAWQQEFLHVSPCVEVSLDANARTLRPVQD
jgi:hypothetical protein